MKLSREQTLPSDVHIAHHDKPPLMVWWFFTLYVGSTAHLPARCTSWWYAGAVCLTWNTYVATGCNHRWRPAHVSPRCQVLWISTTFCVFLVVYASMYYELIFQWLPVSHALILVRTLDLYDDSILIMIANKIGLTNANDMFSWSHQNDNVYWQNKMLNGSTNGCADV